MHKLSWPLLVSLLAFALAAAPLVRAEDKPIDAQYHALADSRTNADLMLRKAREMIEKTDTEWRTVSQATELARGRIGDQIQKEMQIEQRKPDETRDNDKINSLSERYHQIDVEWNKYASTERPAIEQQYGSAKALIQSLSQIYADLTNLESGWKDSKLDLASLQASFDALKNRAGDAIESMQKALDALKEQQKIWENMPEIVPAPAKP